MFDEDLGVPLNFENISLVDQDRQEAEAAEADPRKRRKIFTADGLSVKSFGLSGAQARASMADAASTDGASVAASSVASEGSGHSNV